MKKVKEARVENGDNDLDDLFDDVEDGADEKKAEKPMKASAKVGGPTTIRALVDLPPGMIEAKPHETNTRSHDVAVQDLKDSIAEAGVLVPLQVQKMGDGKYKLLAGTRRLKAAKALGLKTVPCVIMDGEVELVSAVENVVRVGMSGLEEATAYRTLMNEYELTQERLGRLVGKTQAHVSQTLGLLKAPESIKKALAAGKIRKTEVPKAIKAKAGDYGKKAAIVTVPEEELPDGVSVRILGVDATVTIRTKVDPTKDVGTRLLQAMKLAMTEFRSKRVSEYCRTAFGVKK